ncbi:MAG: alanine--glyoxylate aminotransferase family protein [Anaerolineaceae bacterium]|nr:alanine--glyoxylate aminotransferase family protein [Anaerolineaceae bacterium]
MPKHLKLFTPGPGDVEEEVLAAMAFPVIRHYGPDWMELYHEILAKLRLFYQTENDIFIVPGPASALLDMAIGSLVATGQKIIIGTNGFFGQRLKDIAHGYGAIPVPFSAPLGQPLDPEVLKNLLDENPDVEVVAIVHHETSTTVLNPLPELASVVREAGKVLIVDTVSSLGGMELKVDEWGVDICVTGANKCLESIPGIGFISVNERAWNLVDRQPQVGHGWYLSLRTWRKYVQEWGDWHPSPVTIPSNNLLAVLTSMRKISDRGLDSHFEKYNLACQIVRRGMKNLGFDLLVPEEYASTAVTAVKARPEFELAEFSKWLAEERGMAIGGALGELSGKIFRVGHLGKAADREYLLDFLFAVEEFLRIKGLDIPVGMSLIGIEEFGNPV